MALSLVMPVLAVNVDKHVVKNIQITSDPKYDRNPCLLEAKDGTYWLFYTRGMDERGIRGFNGYSPDDGDYYSIFYRTSKSIETLYKAKENLLDLSYPDNAQRDVAAVQTDDGKIWLFASTGLGLGSERFVYCYIYDGSWSGPTEIPGTDYAAHIDALTYNGKIWLFFDYGYTLKVTYYDGIVWSAPADIQSDATIAKAVVADGVFYVVWIPTSGDGIYLSTSADGTTWASISNPIATWEGGYNCDPVLVKDKKVFRLYWAPDIGTEQFIATSTSTDPTTPASWSTPARLTSANDWWDFWPEPYVKGGSIYLFYTSERNSEGTARADANIWMLKLSG